MQVWGLQLYLKRDPGKGVFLRVLQKFYKHFFYKTPLAVASEVELKLAILDIFLDSDGHVIITTVYRKVTNNDMYINLYSFCP